MSLKNYLEELFNGLITFDDLSLLNENLPYESQFFCLKEDLLQVERLDKKYLLDVGWYPEFDIAGFFEIKVIEKYNWEKPLFSQKTNTISALKDILKQCKLDYKF